MRCAKQADNACSTLVAVGSRSRMSAKAEPVFGIETPRLVMQASSRLMAFTAVGLRVDWQVWPADCSV